LNNFSVSLFFDLKKLIITFEQALSKKKEFREIFFDEENNMKMSVLIAPSDKEDFTNIISDFRARKFTDNSSIRYSSNNSFVICALWTDGTDVIHRILRS